MNTDLDSLVVFLLTDVASTVGFVAFASVIALFLLSRKEWRHARIFSLTAVGLAASTTLLKHAIAAPRPEGGMVAVSGYGLPSGHAAGIMFIALSACVLASRLPRTWRYLTYAAAAVLTITIGTSRVYFSVHTPVQVSAGYLLGAFWVFVWIALARRNR